MRAHDDRDLTQSELARERAALGHGRASREQRHTQAEWTRQRVEGAVVLLRQDLGRRQHGGEPVALMRRHRTQQRQHCLAGAHVADNQAVHGMRAREIGRDLRPGAPLIRRELEWKTRDGAPHAGMIRGQRLGRMADPSGAPQLQTRLQEKELLGHQPHVVGSPARAQLHRIEVGAGDVHLAQRLAHVGQSELAYQAFGQVRVHQICRVAHGRFHQST